MGTYTSTVYDHEIELGRAWPRFWARTFDLAIYGLPIAFISAVAFPTVFTAISSSKGPNYLVGMLILPLMMIIDAVIISLLGSSPGKAIAGLYVADMHGNRLTLETSLRRNLQVYVGGLLLGIPLVCLIGYGQAYNQIKESGITTWDESTETRVLSTSDNGARTFLIGTLAIVALVGVSALAAIPQP